LAGETGENYETTQDSRYLAQNRIWNLQCMKHQC